MSRFVIDDINVDWDVEDGPTGTSFVTERVSGIEKAFKYGPVPNSELDDFLQERQAVMAGMIKRFRASKLN